MWHWHHKKPKHAGGTDDASNLELLTVAEHAEAHKRLYEEFGRKEDEIAWRGLCGMLGKEDLIKELQSLGGIRASEKETNPWKRKTTKTSWAINKEVLEKAISASKSQSALAKRIATFKKINHQQKEANSAFGTKFYRDEFGNKKRFKPGSEPSGWILSSLWIESKKIRAIMLTGRNGLMTVLPTFCFHQWMQE